MRDAEHEPAPEQALYRDAVAADRRLKREHRAYYVSDPKGYRETVRRARSRVLRLKPGPKPDRNSRIPKAARERGRGVPWRELYPKYIAGYIEMNLVTKGYAEDGFRRRVNEYLRNHPRLKSHRKTPGKVPQHE